MTKKLFLGIDIGTYETKGVLVDSVGNIISQASKKHEMIIQIAVQISPQKAFQFFPRLVCKTKVPGYIVWPSPFKHIPDNIPHPHVNSLLLYVD